MKSQKTLSTKGEIYREKYAQGGKYSFELIPRIITATIVIPTYNEAGNIEALLDKIFMYEKEQNEEYHALLMVLVVDDNSPDGTAEVVRQYMKNNDRVHLLFRDKKDGLGAAYIAGMKHAIDELDADVVFEMDADHSHDPKDIFRMIEEIEKGYDFVIGSRYISGGEIPEGWGLHRKFISGMAIMITKVGLNLYGVKDCSGGFRAIRREVLEKINLDEVISRGYSFQAELLSGAIYHGFNVKEIPIVFHERYSGKSKMRIKDMLEGFSIIAKVRMRRIKNFFTKDKGDNYNIMEDDV